MMCIMPLYPSRGLTCHAVEHLDKLSRGFLGRSPVAARRRVVVSEAETAVFSLIPCEHKQTPAVARIRWSSIKFGGEGWERLRGYDKQTTQTDSGDAYNVCECFCLSVATSHKKTTVF